MDAARADATLVGETSLGRAFELRATAILVRALRAARVLERISVDEQVTEAELRGVGREWAVAAAVARVAIRGNTAHDGLTGGVPDPVVTARSRVDRLLARLSERPRSNAGRNAVATLVGTPRWSDPYRRALVRRWPALLVDAGRRALVESALQRNPPLLGWLSDEPAAPTDGAPSLPRLDDPIGQLLSDAFARDAPQLARLAALGRAYATDVVVATQDVTPSIRSFLLGSKAAGARVVTLEHGLSGGYAEQVHSVADVLGVWGPLQARYHRDAGPRDLRIEQLGWPRLEQATTMPPARATHDVLFFGQPATPLSAASWPEDSIRSHDWVERYAATHPHRRVAVKPHPATVAYQGSLPTHRHARLVNGDSLSLIRRARVVVSLRSTTALEAMALGRAVILVDQLSPVGPADLLAGAGGIPHVSSAEGLADVAESLLSDEASARRVGERGRAFATRFVDGIDSPGSAVERFIATLDSTLAA